MIGNEHEAYAKESFRLAKSAVEHGNHPFGALLVKDGEILLRAENTVNTHNDCTRHAELNLVSLASRQINAETLARCALYTSTEPCAMCAGAIYWAGISTVVYACSAASLAEVVGGGLMLPCREVFNRGQRDIQVIGPLLEAESLQIHKSFW